MKTKSKANLPIAFASLLLSILLWLVVTVQNVPEPTPVRATLAIDGLDNDRYFIRKPPNDVRLDVSLPPDRAKELGDQQVSASVDLSTPKEGTAEYPVTISPAWIVRYLSGTRPTVRLTVEPIERRKLPVKVIVVGAFKDPQLHLNLDQTRAIPKDVEVVGPAKEVDTVRSIRAFIDLSKIDVVDNEYQQVDVVPSDASGTRPAFVHTVPGTVMVSASFGPTPLTKIATIVADLSDVTYDTTVAQSGGFTLEPNTVLLTGKPETLANVSKVPTEIVHAHGLTDDRTLTVRLIAPAGTEIVGAKSVRLTLHTLPVPKPRTESKPPKTDLPKKAASDFPEKVPPLNP